MLQHREEPLAEQLVDGVGAAERVERALQDLHVGGVEIERRRAPGCPLHGVRIQSNAAFWRALLVQVSRGVTLFIR